MSHNFTRINNDFSYSSFEINRFSTGIVDENKKEAIPILIVPDINEMNISDICQRAILYTLICSQPEQNESDDKGIPTWKYVKDKKIKICIAPVKQTQPILVDLTDVVEENIETLSEWLRQCVEKELRIDLPQAHKIAEYYNNEFYTARNIVRKAFDNKPRKCPEYMYDAFKDSDECDEVKYELEKQLKRHLKRFKRDIVDRLH